MVGNTMDRVRAKAHNMKLPSQIRNMLSIWKAFQQEGKSINEISKARTKRTAIIAQSLADVYASGKELDWSRLEIPVDHEQQILKVLHTVAESHGLDFVARQKPAIFRAQLSEDIHEMSVIMCRGKFLRNRTEPSGVFSAADPVAASDGKPVAGTSADPIEILDTLDDAVFMDIEISQPDDDALPELESPSFGNFSQDSLVSSPSLLRDKPPKRRQRESSSFEDCSERLSTASSEGNLEGGGPNRRSVWSLMVPPERPPRSAASTPPDVVDLVDSLL